MTHGFVVVARILFNHDIFRWVHGILWRDEVNHPTPVFGDENSQQGVQEWRTLVDVVKSSFF